MSLQISTALPGLPEGHFAALQRACEMPGDAETQVCMMEKTAMENSAGSSPPGAHHPWLCVPAAGLLLAVHTLCYFSQSLGMASPPHFSGCVARSWRHTRLSLVLCTRRAVACRERECVDEACFSGKQRDATLHLNQSSSLIFSFK